MHHHPSHRARTIWSADPNQDPVPAFSDPATTGTALRVAKQPAHTHATRAHLHRPRCASACLPLPSTSDNCIVLCSPDPFVLFGLCLSHFGLAPRGVPPPPPPAPIINGAEPAGPRGRARGRRPRALQRARPRAAVGQHGAAARRGQVRAGGGLLRRRGVEGQEQVGHQGCGGTCARLYIFYT